MLAESIVYGIIITVVLCLALAACYHAGLRDGRKSKQARKKTYYRYSHPMIEPSQPWPRPPKRER